MRWKRLSPRQKREARIKYLENWHRIFAWWPKYDVESGTVYWLEDVWCKWKSRDNDGASPWNKEYRGGRDCPEVKQDPGTGVVGQPIRIRLPADDY